MVRVRLRGVHRLRRRLADGRTVEYHMLRGLPGSTFWRTGDSEIGSPEYLAAYQAAAAPQARPSQTFERVVAAYLDSGEHKRLAPRTRADYRKWADRIREKFGDAPVAAFERPAIRPVALAWRDQWTGKQAAYAWTVLRLIVGWAYDRGLIREHHLRGGGSGYRADRAEIVWTDAEIAAFTASAPAWLADALTLATETGLRPGDLVRLTRAHIIVTPRGRAVQIRTAKSRGRQLAAVPLTPAAGAVVDRAPSDRLTVLAGARGAPLDPVTLTKAVKAHARKIGLGDHLRLYDARGTACTRLLMAGASVSEIGLAMGWSARTAASMIETYARLDPRVTDRVLVLLESARAERIADGGCETGCETPRPGETEAG